MKEFKCKDCIHYCVCKDTVTEDNWTDDTPIEIKEIFSPKYCENFFLAKNVVPVVHGKWKLVGGLYHCAVCDYIVEQGSSYCPECGDYMDGGNK